MSVRSAFRAPGDLLTKMKTTVESRKGTKSPLQNNQASVTKKNKETHKSSLSPLKLVVCFSIFQQVAVGSTCSILLLLHCFSDSLLSCQPLSSNVCPLRSLTPLAPVCFWAAHPPDPLFLMFTVIVLGLSAAGTLATYIFFSTRPKKRGNGKTAKRKKKRVAAKSGKETELSPAGSNHHGRSSNSPPLPPPAGSLSPPHPRSRPPISASF